MFVIFKTSKEDFAFNSESHIKCKDNIWKQIIRGNCLCKLNCNIDAIFIDNKVEIDIGLSLQTSLTLKG